MLRRIEWIFGIRAPYRELVKEGGRDVMSNRLEEITAKNSLKLKPVEAGIFYVRRYGTIKLHPGYRPTGVLINGLF
ncbi:MAG: hypothetical protein KKG75_02075 [Nanoarchaeota archaeon]|nr:hypothetical protein [Nanoarchaeota archaeon]